MTQTDRKREMPAMVRSNTWGHILVFCAHGGKLFLGARCLVALKIENAVASMERMIKLQAKLIPRRKIFAIRTLTLTLRSFACSCSVISSLFSSSRSSLKVGLKIMVSVVRGGAPGDLSALLRGVFGVGGGRYFRSVSSISTAVDWT